LKELAQTDSIRREVRKESVKVGTRKKKKCDQEKRVPSTRTKKKKEFAISKLQQ